MANIDLQAWRLRHGISQSQLAKRLPVNIWTLRNWEYGRAEPPRFLYRALADLAKELETKPLEPPKPRDYYPQPPLPANYVEDPIEKLQKLREKVKPESMVKPLLKPSQARPGK